MPHWIITQLKTGMINSLKEIEKEKKNMENKMEIISNEIMEINNIIALAKADDDIRQVFLSEIIREFDDLQTVSKTVFFQDTVFEIIELAKHDEQKKQMLFKTIIESELGQEIQDHYFEFFASNGMIRAEQ